MVESIQWVEVNGEKLYFHKWDELLEYIKDNKIDSYAFVGGQCTKPPNGKFYNKKSIQI